MPSQVRLKDYLGTIQLSLFRDTCLIRGRLFRLSNLNDISEKNRHYEILGSAATFIHISLRATEGPKQRHRLKDETAAS